MQAHTPRAQERSYIYTSGGPIMPCHCQHLREARASLAWGTCGSNTFWVAALLQSSKWAKGTQPISLELNADQTAPHFYPATGGTSGKSPLAVFALPQPVHPVTKKAAALSKKPFRCDYRLGSSSVFDKVGHGSQILACILGTVRRPQQQL
jgi:hypothetical protein